MIFKISTRLKEKIRDYCVANGISNVSQFAESCLEQGFNIMKYGVSPTDNMKREARGNSTKLENGKENLDIEGQDVLQEKARETRGGGAEEEKVERDEEKKTVTRKTFRIVKKS